MLLFDQIRHQGKCRFTSIINLQLSNSNTELTTSSFASPSSNIFFVFDKVFISIVLAYLFLRILLYIFLNGTLFHQLDQFINTEFTINSIILIDHVNVFLQFLLFYIIRLKWKTRLGLKQCQILSLLVTDNQ